jgi:hypothetical protein
MRGICHDGEQIVIAKAINMKTFGFSARSKRAHSSHVKQLPVHRADPRCRTSAAKTVR